MGIRDGYNINPVQLQIDVLLAQVKAANNIYYVSSTNGASSNDGLSIDSALTTITLALAKCTANKGDIIYVLQGMPKLFQRQQGLFSIKQG